MLEPGYLRLYRSGELDERIKRLYGILESCVLCPRECRKNRLGGQKGHCRSGEELLVSAIHPHFGEEAPLVGRGRSLSVGGSGTVFLTNCNLGCVYCQNFEISQLGRGRPMTIEELARGMMGLQEMGCHNVNFVSPTHFVPQLVRATKAAAEIGLKVPLVYNCGGYESARTISLLEGIVDIYMPDTKYSDPAVAERYSGAADYFDRCREALLEMHRQVGSLELDSRGIARRGVLIRHLVLPNNLAGSAKVLEFIAREMSRDSYVNIMAQYRPVFKAREYGELGRALHPSEYRAVILKAVELGLHRGFPTDHLQ